MKNQYKTYRKIKKTIPVEELFRKAKPHVIPAKAGIQFPEFVVISIYLDARFRGHDELCHSL